jgi:hypothetical protein
MGVYNSTRSDNVGERASAGGGDTLDGGCMDDCMA